MRGTVTHGELVEPYSDLLLGPASIAIICIPPDDEDGHHRDPRMAEFPD